MPDKEVTKSSRNFVTSLNGKAAQRTRTPGNHRKGRGMLKSWWTSFTDKIQKCPD